MAKLILLSLPIGNVDDITLRGLKILKEKKYFFAEDTRNLFELLSHHAISSHDKKINSFHDHSDDNKLQTVINILQENEDVVYVSDAGSPIVSDPGHPLVIHVLKNNIEIDSVPGVSSVILGLELSGLPPIPFHFYGFLPRGNSAIKEAFFLCKMSKGTSIFFESGQRIVETLEILEKYCPDFKVVVARELTKKFQSVYRFLAKDFQAIKDQLILKGEFVLLIYEKDQSFLGSNLCQNEELIKLANKAILTPGPKSFSKVLAHILSKDTKEIYSAIVKKESK